MYIIYQYKSFANSPKKEPALLVYCVWYTNHRRLLLAHVVILAQSAPSLYKLTASIHVLTSNHLLLDYTNLQHPPLFLPPVVCSQPLHFN